MQLTALWWWIDRWRKSRAYTEMTLEEQGAYRNLLDEATLRGGPLPNDEHFLAKACGDPRRWGKVRAKVIKHFTLYPDGWRNTTLDEVLHESVRRATNQANYRARRQHGTARDNTRDNAPITPPITGRSHSDNNRDNNPDYPYPYQDPDQERERSLSLSSGTPRPPPSSLAAPDLATRAGQLLRLYAELYTTYRHGAKLRLIGNSLEFEDACSLCRTWDDARLAKLARIVLESDDAFIEKTDRSFKIFALKATWADDRLKAWEHANGVTV